MKYISLFAGIGCADVAWAPLGWEPVAFAETDPFASAVLAARFPGVPNVGDVTAHDWTQYRGRVDLVVGGSPCQSYSVAGRRQSLDDPRGQLTLAFVRACDEIDPAFVVWENVPSVANTHDDAFGCFLGGMVGASGPLRSGFRGGRWPDAGLVAGPKRAAAFGVLDAQYFGVPQRRKRLFLLAVALSHPAFPAGKTPNPAEVLFIRDGLLGHPAPGGAAGQETVATPGAGAPASGGFPRSVAQNQRGEVRLSGLCPALTGGGGKPGEGYPCVMDGIPEVAGTLGGGSGARGYVNSPELAEAFVPMMDGIPEVAGTLGGGGDARGYRNDLDTSGAFIPVPVPPDTARCLSTLVDRQNDTQETMVVHDDPPGVAPAVTAKWAKGRGGPSGDECQNLVAIPILEVGKRTGTSGERHGASIGIGDDGDPMYTLQASAKHGVVCDELVGTVTARPGTGGVDDNDAARGMLVSFHPVQDLIESRGATHALGCGSSKGQAAIAIAFNAKDDGGGDNEIAPTLRAMSHAVSHSNGGGHIAVAAVTGDIAHTLSAEGADASEDGTGRGTPIVGVVALAMRGRAGGIHAEESPELAFALRSGQGGADKAYIATRLSVRRLSPRECERLMGLPDDWTLIPYGKGRRGKDLDEFAAYLGVPSEIARKQAADSLRYKACGNGMAVPVVWWIGRRIEWVLQRLADETPGWRWRGAAWESI